MTLILSNADVEGLLSAGDYIDAMESAFRDLAEGVAANRPRSHTYTPIAAHRYHLFKSMDGSLPRAGVHALRLSSDVVEERVVGGRRRRDKLPAGPGGRWTGLVQLFSIETGELLAILQDGVLQKMRVAATSAVAAKLLSRPDSVTVGMYGTGWQADAQLLALCAVRSISRVNVFSPSQPHRTAFAARMTVELGIPVVAVDDPGEVVPGADIVVAATNSLEPVFDGATLERGVHVNSLQNGELDALTLRRSDVIGVRAKEPSTHWPTRGFLPAEMAYVAELAEEDAAKVQELGALIVGRSPGRIHPGQITLFGGTGSGGSSGLGIQFAAAGHRIYEEALRRGVGRDVPTDWFLEDVHP